MTFLALAIFVGLNAGLLFPARRIAARIGARGVVERTLTTALLAFVNMVIGMEILSTFGQMNAGGMVAWVLLCNIAAGFFAWMAPRVDPIPNELSGERESSGKDRVVILLLLGLVGWSAGNVLARGLALPVEPISDAPIYHLPLAIQWLRSGRIDWVPTPFGEMAASYFPANGSLFFCWLMIPFRDVTLAKVGQFPFFLLGGMAVYGIGRRLGARPASATWSASIWSCAPLVETFAAVANVDLIFAAWYLAAVYFLLDGERPKFRAVLGGLAAGAALGTKSVGLFYVPLLVPVLVLLSGKQSIRQRLLEVAGFIIAALVPSGYWYGRNWLATGNPLYPLEVQVGSWTIFPGWYTASAMRNSGYHLSRADWLVLVDRIILLTDVRLLVPVLLLAFGTLIAVFVRRHSLSARGANQRWQAVLVLALGVAHFLLFALVIPYNTQERFLVAGYGLVLAAIAPRLDGWWWLRATLVGWLGICLCTPGLGAGFTGRPATLGPVLSLAGLLGPPWRVTVGVPLGVALALACLWRPTRLRVWAAAVTIGAGIGISAWSMHQALAATPFTSFYPFATDFGRRLLPSLEILERAAPPGARVAYAGTNLPYYLFGPRLDRAVHYIDVHGDPNWRPHCDHRQRLQAGVFSLSADPWPEWHRENPDYDRWLAALRGKRIDLLFVARENRHGRGGQPALAPFPIENQWASQHPDIFELLGPQDRLGAAPPWAYVYRVHRDPDR